MYFSRRAGTVTHVLYLLVIQTFAVFGINDACDEIPELLARSWVSDYRIEAILGRETHRHEIGAKVTLRADYGWHLVAFLNI